MANIRNIGQAQDVPQITTIAASGTWAANDTATITCNNKSLTVTLGSDVATTDVVEILARAINASDKEDNLKNDETRNFGGREYGEFRDFEATYSGSTLTLTSTRVSDGTFWPFTVARSENTAGTGALGTVTEAQAADGRFFWDNTANWSTGALPTASDEAFFDSGSASIKHKLTQGASPQDNLTLTVLNTYQGQWGLDPINTNHPGYHYPEYRQLKLDVPVDASGTCTVNVGELNSTVEPSFSLRFDFGTVTSSSSQIVNLYKSAPVRNGVYAVQVAGSDQLSVVAYEGSLIAGPLATENITTLKALSMAGSGATVKITDNVAIHGSVTTFNVDAGHLIFDAGASGVNMNITGGTVDNTAAATYGTVNIYDGGTLHDHTGGTTAKVHMGGVYRIRNAAVSLTNVSVHKGATYDDGGHAIIPSAGIDFEGCSPADVHFIVRANQTWTPSAI